MMDEYLKRMAFISLNAEFIATLKLDAHKIFQLRKMHQAREDN